MTIREVKISGPTGIKKVWLGLVGVVFFSLSHSLTPVSFSTDQHSRDINIKLFSLAALMLLPRQEDGQIRQDWLRASLHANQMQCGNALQRKLFRISIHFFHGTTHDAWVHTRHKSWSIDPPTYGKREDESLLKLLTSNWASAIPGPVLAGALAGGSGLLGWWGEEMQMYL